MSKAIQLLLVEDSDDDAKMIVRTLQRAGFDVRHQRVENANAVAATLASRSWDAVISDYNMPGFSGLDALGIPRSGGLDVPFILVSGTAGEEIAVDALKAGAGDYVLKKNLSRLPMVLERELKEAAARAERRQAEADLRKLSVAVRQSGTGIVITDPSGAVEFVNPKFEAMTGYSASEVKGKNPRFLKSGLTPPETFQDLWQTILAGNEWSGVMQNRKKSGELYIDRQHISPVLDESGKIQHFIAVKEDVTEQKRAERDLMRFRAAMDVSRDSIYLTDPAAMRFIYVNNTVCERLNYSREQLMQMGPQDVLSKDRDQLSRELEEVIAAGDRGARHEHRFVRSDGSIGWTELLRRALHTEDGTLIVTVGRDITERKRADAQIRRLNRVYAVLSGINHAIVRIRNREELFKEACRIAVEHGGFHMVWIGLADRAAGEVRVAAHFGFEPDTQGDFTVPLGEGAEAKSSTAYRAMLEKKPIFCNDIAAEPPRSSIRALALRRGLRSVVSLPLVVAGESVGVMFLFASEANAFTAEELDLLRELADDISFALDHISKEERLSYLAMYDQLTGLANRALFLERLNQFIEAASTTGNKIALVIADIERLGRINESLGRQAGDAVIKELAERMVKEVGKAEVARVGADQFAIVLQAIKGKSEAARRIERLWEGCLSEPFRVSDAELSMGAKAGAALFPNDGANAELLLRNAEAALVKTKKLGERYVFYTSSLTARTGQRLTLENQLRRALEKNEFVLHYQPKVEMETRRIVGVEALIRWQSPQLGLVPPMKFIPLMEETGLILDVGAWALDKAIEDHFSWSKLGLSGPRVAVNVSANQLRRRDYVSTVQVALKRGATPPGVDLEITESLVMEDIEGNMHKLEELRVLGLSVAIDDFGTGYSSLGYLAKLPVQTLKIDRSFITTMLKEPDTMTLVQTIISLAHSLRLKVVAEGVDSEEQAKMLRLLRCDEMQGYLISRPIPFDQMTALLNSPAT